MLGRLCEAFAFWRRQPPHTVDACDHTVPAKPPLSGHPHPRNEDSRQTGGPLLCFPGPRPYPQGGKLPGPKDVALSFLLWAVEQPQLAGRWVRAEGLKPTLPEFCRSLCWPCPPYAHFARELGSLTRKRREDRHHRGRRVTRTSYWVPTPAVAVADQRVKAYA